MDLTTYLRITLESCFALFCVLAAIYIRVYRAMGRRLTDNMTTLLITGAVVNSADALAYFYRGSMTDTGHYMVRICNFAVFAGMLAMIALVNLLTDSVIGTEGRTAGKRLRSASYILCAADLAALVLSAFTGFIYYFDAHNYYHRGSGFVIFGLLAAAAMLLLFIRAVRERSSFRGKGFAVIMCLLLLPAAGGLLQELYYGISIYNIANSAAILITLTAFMREAVTELSVREIFVLNGESIEHISGLLDSFLESTGAEKQNRIRIRFTAEEALLRIWEHFDDAGPVKVDAGIKFGKPSIRIEHQGRAFNPFSIAQSDYEDWAGGLLSAAGLSPSYSYSRGYNIIKITLGRMQINPVIMVVAAIVLGLLSGGTALMVLAPADAAFVTQDLLTPVYDLWNRILYSVSAPAMLVIVTATTLDTREVSDMGGSSSRIIGRYFFGTFLVGAVTFAAAAAAGTGIFTAGGFSRETAADLLNKLFNIVPENLIDPFRDFNTAQLILMGLVLAYAILAVGQQASGISSLINQLNLLVMQLARLIAGMMPVFTMFLTAKLVLEDNAGLLRSLLVAIPFALLLSAAVMAVTVIYVGLRMKVSPGLLLRKLWPSFILTLRSGQLENSYALAEKCCHYDLGIQRIFTQRLLPLGLVLYMPASAIGMITFVIYGAYMSGIEMTPVWMLSASIFALILLVAAPPIPGVDILSYVVIIGQLGIDKKYIIAAMIFDIIFNLFASAANQLMLQLDLVLQADKVGLLNHTALRKEKRQDVAT